MGVFDNQDLGKGWLCLDESILRINPGSIYLLRFILEGYDNLFIMTTLDKETGLVCIKMASETKDTLHLILSQIEKQIGLDCFKG